MILGFELILTNYGFWLPNDQRGSGSNYVRSEALREFGPATRVSHRRSVAWKPFDREIRRKARAALKYNPVLFNGQQALAVARGMANEIKTYGGIIHAFGILPNHTHLVVGPPRYDIRRFAGRLKGAATKQLRAEGLHPLLKYPKGDGTLPSPWSEDPWVVYLFSDADMVRTIDYTNQNPVKAGLPAQSWSFVTPYVARTPGASHRR
jgi:REP element-mobilizing transposase RayT